MQFLLLKNKSKYFNEHKHTNRTKRKISSLSQMSLIRFFSVLKDAWLGNKYKQVSCDFTLTKIEISINLNLILR